MVLSGAYLSPAHPQTHAHSPFAPIDPAPAFPVSSSQPGASAASTSTSELLSSIPVYRQTLLDQSQSLFDRYRAMFSLRNAVHAARRQGETPNLSPSERKEIQQKGREAVLALCDSLNDGSALFRHEICFVFGELAHASCVPAMLNVLSNDKEHEMVRHEAAEALGAVVEEGDEMETKQAEDAQDGSHQLSLTDQVMKELKRWAEDLQAPRVVRESCIVALDEMACECVVCRAWALRWYAAADTSSTRNTARQQRPIAVPADGQCASSMRTPFRIVAQCTRRCQSILHS